MAQNLFSLSGNFYLLIYAMRRQLTTQKICWGGANKGDSLAPGWRPHTTLDKKRWRLEMLNATLDGRNMDTRPKTEAKNLLVSY